MQVKLEQFHSSPKGIALREAFDAKLARAERNEEMFRSLVRSKAPQNPERLNWVEKSGEKPAAGGAATGQGKPEPADHAPAMAKAKRSTVRGEARLKLIAVLTNHHKYADGNCRNLEPIGNNELARLADVSKSTASEFLNKEFNERKKGGLAKYKAICQDAGRLVDSLKVLNGEFSPHDLYGRRPPGEDERDGEA
jgi:hypothetical protein